MGQYALIIVAAALLSVGAVLGSVQTNTSDADTELSQYQAYWMARELAITGLNLTVGKLADDSKTGWPDGSTYGYPETEYATGRFSSVVETRPDQNGDYGNQVKVTATGYQPYITKSGSGEDWVVVIEAIYERAFGDGGVPPAFRNAITAEMGLDLRGSIWVHAPGPFKDDCENYVVQNANVHTNTDFDASGNLGGGNANTCGRSGVEGYVTYSGNAKFSPNIKVQPRDIQGADFIRPGDRIEIPPIQHADWLSDPMTFVCNESCSINGQDLIDNSVTTFNGLAKYLSPGLESTTIGTADEVFIYYATAPLDLSGIIDLDGYGIIFATHEIDIGGNVLGGITGKGEPSLLIATLSYIDLAGNNEVRAALYASDFITFRGTVKIDGGIVTNNVNNNGGDVEVVYRGPSKVITDPGFKFRVPIGPILIAYGESPFNIAQAP